MIILGIDTSLRSTGYGVIEISKGKARALDCGIIKNKPALRHSECLKRISGGIEQLVQLYKPEQVSIESTFVSKNAKTAMILGMARGAAISPVAKEDLPIYEYSPKSAKLAVVGTGTASKEQVAVMVGQILNCDITGLKDDATDALALAICHWQSLSHPILSQKIKEI